MEESEMEAEIALISKNPGLLHQPPLILPDSSAATASIQPPSKYNVIELHAMRVAGKAPKVQGVPA